MSLSLVFEPAPRCIALIKPSALGDLVHALPVLGALRARFPRARITWVVNRAYEPLLRGHQALDATLPFDRAALRSGVDTAALAALRFARRLRASPGRISPKEVPVAEKAPWRSTSGWPLPWTS